ncbi:MAG: penicillin-insensitive murein endopeptidase [Myxococcales bacterium]|nr:penicillin-insensitive murein endopeptidase [Myxococcales bacterium]
MTVLGMMGGCALSRSSDEEPSPTAQATPDPTPEGRVTPPEGPAESSTPADAQRVPPADDPSPLAANEGPDLSEDPPLDGLDPLILGDEDPIADSTDDPPFDDGTPAEARSVGIGRPTLAPELELLEHPRWIRHQRAPRETLRQIAIRYGVDEDKLREWNGLGPDDPAPQRHKRVRVWARRMPPPREPVQYTVAEGDTWWGVSLCHGVEPRDLRGYNWPWKKKMQPGAHLEIWIDPLVHDWIAAGPDPLPPDLAHGWRRGAVSIGSPNDGVLVNGLRIPDTEGVHLRMLKSSYGTSHAVEQLLLALQRFRERTRYPAEIEIGIGSMSLPRGGRIGSHLSHQSGRDVDIKLLRRPDVSPWQEIRGKRVEWRAVWDMVQAFSEVDVMVIFLDQRAQHRLFRAARESGATPEQIAAGRRLIQHSPGHEHHLHVRFGCGPFEPECIP